jgi:hypothetical protein
MNRVDDRTANAWRTESGVVSAEHEAQRATVRGNVPAAVMSGWVTRRKYNF